ncbi:MAG: FG-GAP-like repeat-containing protein [Bacteroidota bacterium]
MKMLTLAIILLSLFSFELVNNRSIYDIPLEASGVCTSDHDLDGDLDIIINHGIDSQNHWGGIYMLKNDGYGNFTFMDSIFDTVGWVNYADTILSKTYADIIYRTPDGFTILSYDGVNYSSQSIYAGSNINDFNLGDINNNGHLDIVFSKNIEHRWGIIYNLGNGNFTIPEYYELDRNPQNIVCGDINMDGKDDVIIGGITEIYYSTDSGFVKQQLQDTTLQVEVGDFDNDGDIDIITYAGAAHRSYGYFYENEGEKIFTSYFFNPNENLDELIIKDFNNDGLSDFLFSNWPHVGPGYLLYYNLGDFTLHEPQRIELDYYGEARRFLHCSDMDGNGYNDIITTRQFYSSQYEKRPLEILFNDGEGSFVDTPLADVREINLFKSISLKYYPIPFSTTVTFEYNLQQSSSAQIIIYNHLGKQVDIIQQKQSTGKQQVIWDATGQQSGVYYFRLIAGNQMASGKLVVVK